MIQTTNRPMIEANQSEEERLIERLSRFYHSEYVEKNRPEIRQTPFDQWMEREMMAWQVIVR